MRKITDYVVSSQRTIREAVKHMDSLGFGYILITNEQNQIIAILTNGDFRRAVLKGVSLDENVITIANKDFIYVKAGYEEKEAADIFNATKILQLPVLNKGELVDVVFRETYNISLEDLPVKNLEIPVVIMAGGKGARMKPFTNILPKPLLPIGDKSMLELIMRDYAKYGIDTFYISINYKASIVKAYLDEIDHGYNISFIEERKPLGTAGALKYLIDKVSTPFFVSNCDILIKDKYDKIYDFHKEGNYDLTLVASMQHHIIPYGVCHLGENGTLREIQEKPEYDLLVNTGMYLLNPSVLEFIPENEFYHITHLIADLLKHNRSIGMYPVSEKSWIDVGQWVEFNKSIAQLSGAD